MGIDMRMYRCDHSHEPCHTHMNVQMCTFCPACSRLAGSPPPLTSRLAGCTDLYKCKRRNKEIERYYGLLHLLHLAKGRTPEGHR